MGIKKTLSSVSVRRVSFYDVLKPIERAAVVLLAPLHTPPPLSREANVRTLVPIGRERCWEIGKHQWLRPRAWSAAQEAGLFSVPYPWFCFRGGRVRHVIFGLPVPAGQWILGSKMASTASIRERQTGTRYFLPCSLGPSKAATCVLVAFAGCSCSSELSFLSCSTLTSKEEMTLVLQLFLWYTAASVGWLLHSRAPGGQPSKGWQLVFPFLHCHLTRTLDLCLFI